MEFVSNSFIAGSQLNLACFYCLLFTWQYDITMWGIQPQNIVIHKIGMNLYKEWLLICSQLSVGDLGSLDFGYLRGPRCQTPIYQSFMAYQGKLEVSRPL